MGEYAFLACSPESAISLARAATSNFRAIACICSSSSGGGVVPESRREFDRELGRLLDIGCRIHLRRRHCEFGMAMQPAGDRISERHLDIESG